MKYLFTLIIAVAAIGCKKEPTPDEQKIQLLTNKKWQETNRYVRDDSGKLSEDQWPTLPDYFKDNYTIWYSDGSYTINDGLRLMPQAQSKRIDTGSWSLSNSRITMTSINPNNPMVPLLVTELTDGHLVFEYALDKYDTYIRKYVPIP